MIFQIKVEDDKLERLEALAEAHGFDSPDAYLDSLVNEVLEDDEPDKEQIVADFKQAWLEMKRGEGMTLDEMWKFVEDDN